MGSICLSSPTVLRCQSFTVVQSGILLVPAGLEALVACWTVYANWGLGHRKQLLLGAEGCTYFMLALLDLLSHLLPAVRDNIGTFKVIDTVLGVASVFPIFFYGLFIFFLLRSQFIGCFPRWLKLSLQIIMLVVFLPITLVMYEVASFVGITHGTFSNGTTTIVAVGFENKQDQALWTASTYADLAVLAALQALPAVLAVRRLVHISRQHKEIQASPNGTVHSFGGTIWTTTGLVVGLAETLVGYAPATFAVSLARRILRAISRAKLCVGISLGMESVETFTDVRPDRRRSRLMQLIANPRTSTFRPLSPTAVAFHAAPRAPEKPISQPMQSLGLPGMRAFAAMRSDSPVERKGERVTVFFGGQRAPTLHLRFSELDMPSPSVITEKFRTESPGATEAGQNRRASSSWSMVSRPMTNAPSKQDSLLQPQPAAHAHNKSMASMQDSFRAVQELTPQFPHLPDLNNWRMPVYAHRSNLSKASISRRTVSVGSSISYPSAVGGRLPSEIDSGEAETAPGMRPVTMYYYTGRHRRDTTGDTTRTPRSYHGRGDTISEIDPAPATPDSDDRSSLQPWGTRMPRTSSPESWRETAELGNDSWASRRWVPSGVIDGRSRWASWQPDAESKPESKKSTTPTPPIRQDTAEAMRIPWLRDLDEVEREREERRMYLAPAPSVRSLTDEGSGALKFSRGPTPRTPTPNRPERGPLNSEYVERWSQAPTDVTDEGIALSHSYDSHVLGRMNVV
ncbi:uncharacterized protein SCHCODRAFT_02500140 [Schizophyllum commune H4-8]|nr:uncharacterized protein SCHCODRAFT_02500140 [Schizophyllum commune H4-8]KAI5893369.1 hypothetical protein SCHCODRAFT_02500140 [Schizophyllum commune H4-8]